MLYYYTIKLQQSSSHIQYIVERKTSEQNGHPDFLSNGLVPELIRT